MTHLTDWKLDNHYARLPENFFQRRQPERFTAGASLVAVSPEAAKLVDLNPCQLDEKQLLEWMTGQLALSGSEPLAMKYAGHQFGFYNPELGDGRGLLMAEITNQAGEHLELHLKGAGKTAFSRFGDGRAVLRSSLRELLGSEALHHLGIPTTRALAVALTGEAVQREQLEPGATLIRITPSHLRFGHFEHFYYRHDYKGLQTLAEFALEEHFVHLKDTPQPLAALFDEVVRRTAKLVALWQAYGFCHGVLNTDNMSLLGETLDFGPFAFLDFYQPDFISNHSDDRGRYAFNRQPQIAHWNLICLAQALSPLIEENQLRASLNSYAQHFQPAYHQKLAERLGLSAEQHWPLIRDWLQLCEQGQLDWTRLLRLMAENQMNAALDLTAKSNHKTAWQTWITRWQELVAQQFPDPEIRKTTLCHHNPCLLPRTHLLQEAIDRAHQGDFREVQRLLGVFRDPFNSTGKKPGDLDSPPPEACGIALSCSS